MLKPVLKANLINQRNVTFACPCDFGIQNF